jgi:hypothetical protein
MPQLDISTFIGQVTWISVVFGRYYRLMVTDVVPSLNRIVKFRAKKADVNRGDLRQFDGVRGSSDEQYDREVSLGGKQWVARLTNERHHAERMLRGLERQARLSKKDGVSGGLLVKRRKFRRPQKSLSMKMVSPISTTGTKETPVKSTGSKKGAKRK